MKRVQRLNAQVVPLCVEGAEPRRAESPKAVTVEFYFDVTSPWTYMGFSRIREVCAKTGANLILKPFIVGGVFNVVNKGLYAMRDKMMSKYDSKNPEPKKARGPKELYFDKDQLEWADYLGLDIKTMAQRLNTRTGKGLPGHPIRSVGMIRGCIVAMDEGKLEQYAFACFDAYWGTLSDTDSDETLKMLCKQGGLSMSPEQFVKRVQDQDVKDRLRGFTDEVLERGGFGSPTIYISAPGFETRMFFGNDRMQLVEGAILRAQGKPWRFHDTYGVPRFFPQPQNQPQTGWAGVADGVRVADGSKGITEK